MCGTSCHCSTFLFFPVAFLAKYYSVIYDVCPSCSHAKHRRIVLVHVFQVGVLGSISLVPKNTVHPACIQYRLVFRQRIQLLPVSCHYFCVLLLRLDLCFAVSPVLVRDDCVAREKEGPGRAFVGSSRLFLLIHLRQYKGRG